MIDIKLVRDEPDRVRASQQARGEDPGIVDAILAADERRRSSLGDFEALRAEQKTVSRSVQRAMSRARSARSGVSPMRARRRSCSSHASHAAQLKIVMP